MELSRGAGPGPGIIAVTLGLPKSKVNVAQGAGFPWLPPADKGDEVLGARLFAPPATTNGPRPRSACVHRSRKKK